MNVRDLLEVKGSRVVSIPAETTVLESMSIFSTNRIGSLLVVDKDEQVLGIICARDVLMATLKHVEGIRTLTVETIMTKNLIVAAENDDLDYVRAIMTEKRIRHLPVLKDNKLIGLISMGDVVSAQVTEKDVELKYFKDYIADKYPG
ncbi:CBS domain-containing protein [Desulfosediminicola flagellatus]|uniref:CBS domain-containing protein n=1 Tax=Desulfosediminicola flagellatus TaxID=2569541 RepID=UPI0010AD674C|nr:CBS domain-containing protein [Desulfosediminicola flagellatus]